MRRATLLLVAVMAALLLSTTVALAVTKNCTTTRACNGTNKNDILRGNNLANQINGLGGNDTISGSGGNDRLNGSTGTDTLSAGSGNDSLSDSGTTNDRYAGFAGAFGFDVILDRAGGADSLDMRAFSSAQTTPVPLDKRSDPDTNADSLGIVVSQNNVVVIDGFFDNTSPDPNLSGPGRGLVETIRFKDRVIRFGQAQAVASKATSDAAVRSMISRPLVERSVSID